MNIILTVFQFEIRYDHILNFSQIARKILAPYVRLSESLKVENQNTLEERIILNFEKENYLIIVSWDRILIKGQENIDKFTEKNSPFQVPFLDILDKLKELAEFGSIKNLLFASNYLKKIDTKDMLSSFMEKSILPETQKVLQGVNDIAISLERKENGDSSFLTYGPYFGTSELKSRSVVPVNLNSLDDTDFTGIMVEYKRMIEINKFSQSDFTQLVDKSKKEIDKIWKMF